MKTSCKAHQAQVHAGERELLQMDGNHEDVSGEQAKRDQMRDGMGCRYKEGRNKKGNRTSQKISLSQDVEEE